MSKEPIQPFNQFRQHLFFKYILKYEKFRHRHLILEIHRLAAYLNDTIFPALQAKNKSHYTCQIDNYQLIFSDLPVADKPPDTFRIAKFLQRNGINNIVFDSRLEKNQIVESLSVLIYAASQLKEVDGGDVPVHILNSTALAKALINKKGLQRFCARIQFDRDRNTLTILYSYCELFYTYSLNQVFKKIGQQLNHRSLFAFAPWAGIAAFLLLFFHIWFWGSASTAELAAGLFASVILGLATAYFFQTLASTVYDKEHQEVLVQERIKEITTLSQFPQHNPNPILKTDKQGKILFHNAASQNLLQKMERKATSYHELLPQDADQIIQQCLATNSSFDIEASRYNRELRYTVSAFSNEEAVFWAITDITRLKKLEHALRDLNQSLEIKVKERTHELESTRDVTILTLSSLAETRDPDTGAHLQRTRLYVKTLAQHLRTNPNFSPALDDDLVIDLLYRSAPLHDIGKVGIPDSILLKPGPLTPAEFELMKEHPRLGGDSLKLAEKTLGSNAFLRYAWEIAYYHHEKWDGSGYPFGLKGDDIPISSRLMALADVYDALISKRVYKKAFTHEKSREIIEQGKGTHFDPAVVDAFLAEGNTFIAIARQYAE